MSNKESLFKNKSIRLAFAFLLTTTFISTAYYLYSSSVNSALLDAARTESAARDRATAAKNRATAAKNTATAASIRSTDTRNKTKLFIACKANGWGDCERYNPYPKDTGIKKGNNP